MMPDMMPGHSAIGTKPLSNNLDVERVRRDFPALSQRFHGHPLVYLDNAATTQKPLAVIDRMSRSNVEECANIHRGVYQLSERATVAYEGAREKVQHF
ncbi:MAG TPA: aminotransferase class V-fold PLP-dependent enzyme, partial [Polyangia bacterium]